MNTHRQMIGNAYRVAGDIAETNEATFPYVSGTGLVRVLCFDLNQLRDVRRNIGGTWNKQYDDYYMNLTKDISYRDMTIPVEISVPRGKACERKVVGTEIKRVMVDGCPVCEVPLDDNDSCPLCGYDAPKKKWKQIST